MNKNSKRVALTGVTAAIYAMLTLFLPFPAYGQVQCRLSEVLNLLPFINPVFAPGIVLGCFVANLFSPVSPLWDSIVGTASSAIAMLFVTKFSKNLLVASLWPTVFCVFIGGMILAFSGMPITLTNYVIVTATVMAGEFIAMTLIGYPLFRQIMKNKALMHFLKRL